MRKLDIFYDYACPYCLRGHQALLPLLEKHRDIVVEWHPVEAHPRPEPYHRYSDLTAAAYFFAREQGVAGDALMQLHQRLYAAALKDGVDIESPAALSGALADILDAEALRAALEEGRYTQRVLESNTLAYEHNGVWAVPALRMEGKRLDAAEGIGVAPEALAAFLEG